MFNNMTRRIYMFRIAVLLLITNSSSSYIISNSYHTRKSTRSKVASFKLSSILSCEFSTFHTNTIRMFSTNSHEDETTNMSGTYIDNDDDEDDDDEVVEPGEMKLSEIKAELNMRSVDFADCFDKDSMVQKLRNARASGKADPSILKDFNNKINEVNYVTSSTDIKDEDIKKVVGNDGKLPGGMSPEMVQQLMKNPELVELLKDPKMQECMQIMMTEGQEGLEQKMKNDVELRDKVIKLNKIMASSI